MPIALPFLLGMIMPKDQDPQKERLDRAAALGHELRDLPARGILLFGIAFLIVMAMVFVVATATDFVLMGHLPAAPFPAVNLQNAPVPTLPPEPRLEAEPGQQLQELRSVEDQILHSYGWVDQKAGIVHIPIDRAMDILAQRGLPSRPAGQSQFEDNGQESPSYPSSGRVPEPYP